MIFKSDESSDQGETESSQCSKHITQDGTTPAAKKITVWVPEL